jgi:hypothetical protein
VLQQIPGRVGVFARSRRTQTAVCSNVSPPQALSVLCPCSLRKGLTVWPLARRPYNVGPWPTPHHPWQSCSSLDRLYTSCNRFLGVISGSLVRSRRARAPAICSNVSPSVAWKRTEGVWLRFHDLFTFEMNPLPPPQAPPPPHHPAHLGGDAPPPPPPPSAADVEDEKDVFAILGFTASPLYRYALNGVFVRVCMCLRAFVLFCFVLFCLTVICLVLSKFGNKQIFHQIAHL